MRFMDLLPESVEALLNKPGAERAIEQIVEQHTDDQAAQNDRRRTELLTELATVAGDEEERLPTLRTEANKLEAEAMRAEEKARLARRKAQKAKLAFVSMSNTISTRKQKLEGEILRLEHPAVTAAWLQLARVRNEVVRRMTPSPWPEDAPLPRPYALPPSPRPGGLAVIPDQPIRREKAKPPTRAQRTRWDRIDRAMSELDEIQTALQELATASAAIVKVRLGTIESRLNSVLER